MKQLICICCMACFAVSAGAQEYAVAGIPDSLLLHANAITRKEELKVTIKSLDKVIVHHKYAITILNEQGDEYAEYSNNYSTLEGLGDISGNLYDAAGKKIRSVRKKEIQDIPVSDGFSLMQDDRIKRHNFYYKQYPYTVEYEDEQVVKGTYFLPYWRPVPDGNYAVESSVYIIETPPEYKLRFKELNMPAPVQVKPLPQSVTYTWELKRYKAQESEPFQPSFNTITPMVYTGADDFSIQGYKGNMSSWQNLGKFQLELNKGRDVLPEAIRKQVHALVDNITDRNEKVKKLYRFLQENTRYISIQLGIGGWQPFDASYVANNRYGDCKALSNYMVSLLKEAGIRAHYVIINAGSGNRNLKEDFPAPYFNHVIACVPGSNDTLWLECTSQTEAPGYLGSFTGDRTALLINEDGGHVVKTPSYKAEDNLQIRAISAGIDETGKLTADVATRFTGTQQETAHALIHQKTETERQKYLNSRLGLPTYTVDKFSYAEQLLKIPVINESLHVTAPNYATVSGKRLFIDPVIFNKSSLKLAEDAERKFPIIFYNAYKDIDSATITLPAGYELESLPKDVAIQSRFGSYSIRYQVTGQKIQMVRKDMIEKASFPPSDYAELVKYFETIYKADHTRMVFVKKGN